MLSIVQHRDDAGKLMVRARIEGDIERVFPRADVITIPGDYRFRAVLSRSEVEARVAQAANEIDYDDFKSSVSDQGRHDAYLRVWEVMQGEQQRRLNKSKRH